jgi:hypothetical protein
MSLFYALLSWAIPRALDAGERYFESDEGKAQAARARTLGKKVLLPFIANAGDPISEAKNDGSPG